ncbi:sf-assemblin [Cryptosporidium ryanae]|uniref:sf-assemblin n=1 Tax=Cryptosporidium ryanae TaxID=515981 RepID=UPI00351A2D6C|nr:sf-assemblin [Cryptosporidium ryanae]
MDMLNDSKPLSLTGNDMLSSSRDSANACLELKTDVEDIPTNNENVCCSTINKQPQLLNINSPRSESLQLSLKNGLGKGGFLPFIGNSNNVQYTGQGKIETISGNYTGIGVLNSPSSIISNSSSLPLSTKQKLGQIQGQLLGLEKQLRNDTRQKREYEENRFQILKENTLKLKKAIENENQQRNEIQENMKKNFEQQLTRIQQKLENIFIGKLDQLSVACKSLDERLSIIEKEIMNEKSQILEEFEQKNENLLNEVMNAKAIAEREYQIAQEKEEQIKLFLKELESHVEDEINKEINNKELYLNNINNDFNSLKDKIEKNQDKFQNFVLEEIAHIKNDIAKESQNREAADDDIVQALNQYTKALQDVLKIIC